MLTCVIFKADSFIFCSTCQWILHESSWEAFWISSSPMAEVALKHFIQHFFTEQCLLDRHTDGVSGDSLSWDSLVCLYLLPSICGPRVDDEFIMILWDGKEKIQKKCNKKKYKYRREPPYLLLFYLHSSKAQYLITCCGIYHRLEKCWATKRKETYTKGHVNT